MYKETQRGRREKKTLVSLPNISKSDSQGPPITLGIFTNIKCREGTWALRHFWISFLCSSSKLV